MSLSVQDVETLAPDQASLKSASKLVAPAKWPLLARNSEAGLIWGECQGSGSNPYRVVVDENDRGTKCTCPSRKFPCKHALALIWIRAEATAPFAEAPTPDWITDWLGRRRKTGAPPAATDTADGPKKSVAAIREPEPDKAETPEAIARKQAAKEKRAVEKKAGLMEADVNLVADLVSLRSVMPAKTKEVARELIAKIVAELIERLERKTAEALRGAVDKSRRTSRPRFSDIDWHRTINANLRHYQHEHRTIIPERLIGFQRQQRRMSQLISTAIQFLRNWSRSLFLGNTERLPISGLAHIRTENRFPLFLDVL